jgi:hypothetical protein
MGCVYLAVDERLGRHVAIKTLSNRYVHDSVLRERFMREARTMAGLSHPHIVRIYNLGQPDELPHFVMEHIDGVPLTTAAKALNLRQKLELMHKVILAVEFLHQHQMMHRDLKPGNILVGHDLEPKLLDFGLALRVNDSRRLSQPGIAVGTPRYFSPEQARAEEELDARSDVFSLGTILYELLTGTVPFLARTVAEEIEAICNRDPTLPKRINPEIPGEVQNICLQAMEKSPADRYPSAQSMAEDIARYLAGEQSLAAPTSYSRMIAGKVNQHLRELEAWKNDEILSEEEYRPMRKGYNRLIEREDAWILEVRRLTVAQVTLYLGAWLSVIGAALLVLFEYRNLTGLLKVAVAGAAVIPMGYIGVNCWNRKLLRTGVAYLLAFCLLLPLSLLVTMGEYNIASKVSPEKASLELFNPSDQAAEASQTLRSITNNQLWWALLLSLPAFFWLRGYTRSSVFSLVLAVATALLCAVQLLRWGLLEWHHNELYIHLLPFAFLFFVIGMIVEQMGFPNDSRYFYPIAVALIWSALTGIAAYHEGYLRFVNSIWPSQIDNQREYLFLVNASIYMVLQAVCRRMPLAQIRSVGQAFHWVIPSHVFVSLAMLNLTAMNNWGKHGDHPDLSFRFEARFFEVLIPCIAVLFVFRSIPRQKKNYFVWGMIFVALGIIQLQQELFEGYRAWLISLILGGLAIMFASNHYSAIRIAVSRWFRRTA